MAKSKATCRVAMLGDVRGFFMLPRCVVDSAAYRDLSVYARAALVEIGSRFDGFNNGRIGIDQRTIMESLSCRPANVVKAIADLMEHGLIDVSAEGSLAAKKAREYRLTFVSTPNAPATNDYARWTPTERKSCATDAVTAKPRSATTVVTGTHKSATDVVTAKIRNGGKPSVPSVSPATDVVSHISKPYPPAPAGERKGDRGSSIEPLPASGPEPTARQALGLGEAGDMRDCRKCGSGFTLDQADRAYPRLYCSPKCRKAAENDRARNHRRTDAGKPETGAFAHLRASTTGDDGRAIGQVLNGSLSRLIARASA